ncbi:hypothetical protein ERJ75_001664200 [Trypanosoma vivax]|nr:hypothetical protein ERJ75_001664200 [Trypanosoma vivax]
MSLTNILFPWKFCRNVFLLGFRGVSDTHNYGICSNCTDGSADNLPESRSLFLSQLRSLRTVERDALRCGKVVHDIAACVKESRLFKRLITIVNKHFENGSNGVPNYCEVEEFLHVFKRRALRTDRIWSVQDERLRHLQEELDCIREEVVGIMDSLCVKKECPERGGTPSSARDEAANQLQTMHQKVSSTVSRIRDELDEMQRQRLARRELLLDALRRCSPRLAAAYMEDGVAMDWGDAVAVSASMAGMLLLAAGTLVYKRYELR